MDTTEETTNTVSSAVKKLKGFKASSDIENFYRFVYENNLRREAGVLLKSIVSEVLSKSKRKSKKLQ